MAAHGRLVHFNDWLLIDGLARKAVAAGLPLYRLTATIRFLHPQVIGTTFTWKRDGGEATMFSPPHGLLQSATFLHSPFAAIMRGEVSGIRRRLDVPSAPIDFPILKELKEQVVTDYVAMPIHFSDGSIHAMTFSTDRPGGFSTAELSLLYDMLPAMASPGDPCDASHCENPPGHLRRPSRGRTCAERPDQERRRRFHSRRNLVFRPSQLDSAGGLDASGRVPGPVEPIFRVSGRCRS